MTGQQSSPVRRSGSESERSPNGVSNTESGSDPIALPRTYVRTDAPRLSYLPPIDIRLLGDARAKNGEEKLADPTPWGQVIIGWQREAEQQFNDSDRWPVLRTGEREPIRWAKRLAILSRDHFQCRICGSRRREVEFEIDHIVPWSALGSDHSSNLRALCKPCNQRRSNANDRAEHTRVLPVTLWCWACWRDEIDLSCIQSWENPDSLHMATLCYRNDPRFAVDHRIPDDANTLAYCAHCGTQGYTDVTL